MDFSQMVATIALDLQLDPSRVKSAILLLDDEKTIPFIARYRKELTGSLDETQLRQIAEKIAYLRRLQSRKEEVLRIIGEQEKLTDSLQEEILSASTLQQVEDLYLPFKKRKKTRADIAREKGLEPLFEFLRTATHPDPKTVATFLDPEKGIADEKSAIGMALDILREAVTLDIRVREMLRQALRKRGRIECEQDFGPDPRGVFKDLYELVQPVSRLQPHRILAINRGESEGVLKVKLSLEQAPLDQIHSLLSITRKLAYFEQLAQAIQDGYSSLLFPSIEREIRNELTSSALERAMQVFASNLKDLMLTPPLRGKTILGLDPGFRTGCKCAVVDHMGFYKTHATIYPHPPHSAVKESENLLQGLVDQYGVHIIAIGNGTASRETEAFVAQWLQKRKSSSLSFIIVSEAGASVYSASQNAIDEFPDLDVTTRGAISIARRVQDPLAELVKIPPESIGVGMYQHDLPEKELQKTLAREVESVVNFVGVDLNGASPFLLQYISGLNKKTAWAIDAWKKENGPFQNRMQLKQVKGIGPKAFEQAAGFCRVPGSSHPLDNTIIHPESYQACADILEHLGLSIEGFSTDRASFTQKLKQHEPQTVAHELSRNPVTVKDIFDALLAPYLDPREAFPQPLLKTDVRHMEDLKPGMVLQGTVRNVVDFGAFVDIGVKVDGLVHRSKLGIKGASPLEVLRVGQIVEVKILGVDLTRQRINLAFMQ